MMSLCAADISTKKSVGTSKSSLDVSSLGAVTYSIPLELPKGYGQFVPKLSFTYNSQTGYGLLGYGSGLSGLSAITRGCKDLYHDGVTSGVRYQEDDAYYLDGKRLIYQSGNKGQEGGLYVLEGTPFAKVFFHGTSTNIWIEVVGEDGTTSYYGKTKKLLKTSGASIATWYLEKTFDAQGHFINYAYDIKNNYAYPTFVTYGMTGGITNVIRFSYENLANPTAQSFNLGGIKGNVSVRLKTVSSETNNQIYRKYICEYDSTLDSSKVRYSRLVKVIEQNGAGEEYNPIVFEWKGLPGANMDVTTPNIDVDYKNYNQEITSKMFVAADLNGDGISDIVKVATVNDEIEKQYSYGQYTTSWILRTIAYVFLSKKDANGKISYEYSMQKSIENNVSTLLGYFLKVSGSSVLDIDGNGKQCVLLPIQSFINENNKTVYTTTWYILKQDEVYAIASKLRATSEVPFYTLFDADKDGRDEIVYIEKAPLDGKYVGGCVFPGNKDASEKSLSFQLPSAPKRLFSGDFNADGMMDLLVVYDGGYKIFFNNGNFVGGNEFSDDNSYSGTSFGEKWRIEQGDFDGDGLIDLLLCDKNGNVSFALNNGDGTFNVKIAASLDMKDKNTNKDDNLFTFVTYDQDGDGKTDLLVSKADFKYHGGLHNHYSYRNTKTSWFRSDGNHLVLEKTILTDNEEDALPGNILVGNFTSDGLLSVMNYGKNLYAEDSSDSIQMRLYTNADYSVSSGKVTTVIDGLGGESKIEYASLLNEAVSIPDVSKALYPVVDLKEFLPVVKKIVCNDVAKDFQYGGLKYHCQGLGMLGFEKTLSYDKLQRMVDKKQYNKDRFYHYTYGNRCVTTTIGNQSYVKSTDAWGNVKNVSDPVGSVSYKYNSMGKPIEVNSNGATVSLEYDEVGNRISLADPDAGTIRSEYAADGKLLKQTDARGIVTTNSYDELGRLTISKIGETEISHVYGTSGNEKLRLVKSMSNGNMEEYTHDEFGRLTSKTRTVHDGNVLKYTYTYDDKDRLIGQTYPGGLKQTYCYDENGYKVRNVVNGILVSSLVNFDGKTSQIKLLDNLVVQDVELDNGGRIATNRMSVSGKDIFNMQCKYDSKTGNLLSRSGVNDEQEIFEYDEADRLLSVKNGDEIVLDVKYSENGNIVCKSDVGNYVYGLKPHAVMSVDNVNGIIPSASLMTKFNGWGKIGRIADGNTLRSLDFSYGPDGQRWTTSLEINGKFAPIITYGDNYEKVITNNTITREFYYVDDNIIFVRTNRCKDFVPLLMTKDNLGSVLSIYDAKMNKIFDASYDAWGKQTVSTNLLGFIRGYCGHEMLNNFDIVNMNGRLYDPVLGRFLSPDNYVQMPDNSQNFNRYSYCLNNPMKYTDPSGEFFVFTLFNAVCDLVSNPIKHGFNVSRYNWKKTTNAFKIDMGLFKGSLVQILSRFTWESFQTSLGYLYSHGRNIFSSVDAVEYFGGATYLIDKNHKKNNGVTIGPYININSTEEIPRDEYGNFAPYKNYLYMHEYGHYLQSQEYGFGYIFTVGIPSLYNTSKKEMVKVIDNDTGNPTYYSKVKTMWFERHANGKASKYFKKKYNIEWDTSLYPISVTR